MLNSSSDCLVNSLINKDASPSMLFTSSAFKGYTNITEHVLTLSYGNILPIAASQSNLRFLIL